MAEQTKKPVDDRTKLALYTACKTDLDNAILRAVAADDTELTDLIGWGRTICNLQSNKIRARIDKRGSNA